MGTATSGTVSSGSASVSYALPAGTTAKDYTIQADYHDANGNFGDSSDSTHTLTVGSSATNTTASNASASDVDTSVTLSATVTSTNGTVNQGSVTFTVVDGSGHHVGSGVSGDVSNGSASASFIPTGIAPGQYTIKVSYTDASGDFADSNDSTHTLTISPGPAASVTLVPGDTSGVVGTDVSETATVKDQYGYVVADGTTVDFSVTGITTTSGSATTTDGQTSFSYSAILPGTDSLVATAEGGANPFASASITWAAPMSTQGARLIVSNTGTPTIMGLLSARANGGALGLFEWRGPGVSVMATQITALVVDGQNATAFGTATLANRETVTFRLDVVGGLLNGTARLRLSTGYDSGVIHVRGAMVMRGLF